MLIFLAKRGFKLMKQEFYDVIVDNPIIAAVKDDEGLEACLKNDSRVVFALYGEVSTIEQIVAKLKKAGKIVFVHLDLIGGLSAREESVRFIQKYTEADGIISTKLDVIRYAKKQGLSTVFRIFVIDSKALESMNHHSTEYADLIELLPGVMPKIIKKVAQKSKIPIIAGGLIADKEDVIAALDAGATAISSTNQKVWKL